MQHFTKGAIRVAKNYTKGYSDTQAKVREATSNDAWGPSGTQMNEIAQLTYNQQDFVEIMEMLDKRLNDKGKNWRHVFKSLTLLDYCLHQGSENVVLYFRDNIYVVKTLKEFQFIDEESKDQGSNVRQKAKDITSLLQDENRLRTERRARASMRDRMTQGGSEEPDDENNSRRIPPRNRGKDRDEDELRKAIEESKKSLAIERQTAEDRDLEEALKMSEEEENKRRKDVDDTNAKTLFEDDSPAVSPGTNQSNNPFPFVDPTPYAVGLQPQPQFQLQPQYTALQPQLTSFNPYQQQMQQEVAQAQFLQQQAAFQQQQQLQQQQQQQQVTQDEWLRQQMMQQQMLQPQQQMLQAQQPQLTAQPTGFGSNNPFAPSPPPSSVSPPLPTNGQYQQPPSFNLQGTYDNRSNAPEFGGLSSSTPPQPNQQQQPHPSQFKVKTNDGDNQQLASLFANRDDGQDSFGNVGAMRYGHTYAAPLVADQNTGNNPFAQQQQQQKSATEQPFFSL